MSYRLHYAGYPSTALGPPDPAEWVGPPGPPGPPGPAGAGGDLASPPPIGNVTANTGAFTSAVIAATSGNLLVGGTQIGGKTRIEINPTNPQNGKGAIFLNRVGTTTGTDDPQIRSFVRADHSGGSQYRHMQIETQLTGNPGVPGSGGGSWANFFRTYYSSNDVGGGIVGGYIQTIRTGVNAGGTRGANGWAAIINAVSETGLPSSQDGKIQTLELNLTANGADDHPEIGRTVLTINPGQFNVGGATCEVAYGITFFDEGNTFYRNFIGCFSTYSVAGFSTAGAVPLTADAHAIWVGDDQHIALDDAGDWRLQYQSSSGRVKISRAGIDRFSIDSSGNVRASGTITASTTP